MAGTGGGNCKKADRNKLDCKAYAGESRAEKSKARKLAAHIARCPWDRQARAVFDALPVIAKQGHVLPPLAHHTPSQLRAAAGNTLTALKRLAA